MKTSKLTKVRSIVVLIVAAILLELTTAIQYFSTRRVITQQMSEMAQRDLSETNHTAQLKDEVEEGIARIMPEVERLYNSNKQDSLRLLIKNTLKAHKSIVGIDLCRIVTANGHRDGIYIYEDKDDGEVIEQIIEFDYTERSWYSQGIKSNGFWCEPYMSNYYVDLMSTYSRPIHDAHGNVVAVIGADLPMHELSALVTQLYENQQDSLLPIILLHIVGLLALAFIIQRSIHSVRKLRMVRAEKDRIESELNIAHDIQEAMLPKTFPPYPDRNDIDIYAQLTPAREVGGDFYDFLIRDDKLFFCIGDVSGKGVPAALLMAVARSTFRMLASRMSQPERIVSAMNETMAKDNEYNMFITLFVGVLNMPNGTLNYCNAGHKAPIIIPTSTKNQPSSPKELNILPNVPVGVLTDWEYSAQETTIAPLTTILLYTDGLTEAENNSHDQFSLERVMKVINTQQPQQLISDISNVVHAFVGDTEQSDDLTMMAINYMQKQPKATRHYTISLYNDIKETPQLGEFVNTICKENNIDSTTSMQINLALEEAVVNVMEYAYPEGMQGSVTIDATVGSGQLNFKLYDNGTPFDPTTQPEVDTTLTAEQRVEGGLGIHLMRRFMDSIDYEHADGHNILTLKKNVEK